MTNKSMRGKMKKAFACTLSAAVLMSSAAVPAFAADEDATVNAEVSDVEVEDEAIEENDADAEVEVAEDTDAEEDAETEVFDDTEEAEAFDDGTAAEVGDGSLVGQKSVDLVDMTDKNPIQVTNANISEILNAPVANTNGHYYQLTEDIVLSGWKTAERFGGVLDGNGHTITLKDNSGCLIAQLTGTLQNIGFLGSVTSGSACVAATLQGKILNCYLDMTTTSEAGIANQVQSAVVSGCAVNVTTTADKFYPIAYDITNMAMGMPKDPATVTNCFWSEGTSDSSKGTGYSTLTGSTVADCYPLSSDDMLEELNANKGANAVNWVAGTNNAIPVLKNVSSDVKNECTVSFTDWHGVKHENVQDTGIDWRIQDVPSYQNIGTLEVSGYDGSQGKVVWLLSQYNSGLPHYEWPTEEQSNIWPGFYSAGIAVKGTGTAKLIAWAEDSLTHTVEKQDVPNENSLKLAEVDVTVTSGNVDEIRLLANGEEITDNKLTVEGSEWISLQPQTRDGNVWADVPVSSIKFPESSPYTYESLVTNTEAKYRAKQPGTFTLTVEGFDHDYTVEVTTTPVKVKAIKPGISGVVKVYPSDYQGDGSQKILGTAITRDVIQNESVEVTPSNASYANSWTMTSSDKDIADYTGDIGGTQGIVPKKIGEVTFTATSNDPSLETQVSGSTTVKFVYADEVAVAELQKVLKALPEAGAITKDNEAAVKEARFIYDNMSDANKKASASELAKLTKCEEKIAEIKKPAEQKPEATKAPEVKPAITLNYESLPLAVKQSTSVVKIKSTAIKGDKIKSAKSSNKKVVAVSVKNGKLTVKGLKKGTAVVTVTSANGATAKVTFKVQKKAVALKKLSATVKRNCVVTKGKKATLKVIKTPVTAKGTVKWTSSNKKVATVSSKGVVTAKKKGTATITAKVGNKKVTFKVTVK